MSVEAPKVEETTPVVAKPVETTTETPVETPAAAVSSETPAEAAKETETSTAIVAEPSKTEAAVVDTVPATEGTLGYKEPGFLKQFRFIKHFFWFSDEPISAEGLDTYIKGEKPEIAHANAAWAQETGKGVLFYSKRAEDKAHPTGMIILPEANHVTKIGLNEFSFKVGQHTHKFEAATQQERNSWIVAVEKLVSESKGLKEDITGRESYKKTIEGYSFSPIVAGAAAAATTPKKSLDATTAPTEPAPVAESTATDAVAADEAKKAKDAKKERSQSRKRNSVFGMFGKKDEDKELKKEEKAEKKAEKEQVKEEKKAEAEQKKEEAKAEHDSSKAKEAVEAAAVAAVPASVAVAAEKHEENKAAKADEKSADEASPTEKKSKRASVFGSLFQKSKVTSPTSEKTEKDAGSAVPAKDTDVPPVSETAPKIEEPIDTKPIDTAAVTAPVDAAETPAVVATEAPKEPAPTPAAATAESATSPKTEKKGFLAGLIKKPAEKREEKKEEKAAEEAAKDPLAAAAVTDNTTTEPVAESPAKEAESAKEERPAREKRRTSLFGSLGTLKRKGDKSPAPEASASDAVVEGDVKDSKREKSPLPSKLGGLFRKPSRAVKSEKPAEEVKTDAPATTEAAKTETDPVAVPDATPHAEGTTTVVEPQSDSKIVGDVVPDELHTVHDAVTTSPAEVKASA